MGSARTCGPRARSGFSGPLWGAYQTSRNFETPVCLRTKFFHTGNPEPALPERPSPRRSLRRRRGSGDSLKDCGCEGSQVTLAPVSQVVRKRQGWAQAMGALQEIFQEDGMEAEKRAADLATRYEGARALAVIDVVASRQRLYQTRVLPMVDAYRGSRDDHGLRQLRDRSPNDILKLRTSQDEGGVMQRVAGGLVAFAEDHGLESDDSACRQWAHWVDPVAHAPKLDPYVGSIKGIGPALFAYLRLLSGADTLKPDVQTKKVLGTLGFDVPDEPSALLLVAEVAASELGISMAALDQLLWWATQPEVVERGSPL